MAKALADRADELVDELEEAVIRKSGLAEVALVLPHDDVRDAMCRANIRSILAAMVDETQFDGHRQRRSASGEPATKRPCHRSWQATESVSVGCGTWWPMWRPGTRAAMVRRCAA